MFVRWEIGVAVKLKDLGYAELSVGIPEMKNIFASSQLGL